MLSLAGWPQFQYLKHGVLPDDKNQARTIHNRASELIISGNNLLRKNLTKTGVGPLLRFLALETADLLFEIHEGKSWNQIGPRTLALKALLQGFYWHIMKEDAKLPV